MKDEFASLNPSLLFEFIYVALTSGFSLRLENEANSGFSPEPREIMAKAGYFTPAYLRHEWRS
ncbi:MAG TPA: hypothetical protein ACFYEK_09835 [Candidatus Wunengus sp. YC60]|uniref:hypothetical protein n=1 Tax=Candidatus Wunengus sp. YC60 TaxID=3367697 RepID=UPI0040264A65